MFKVEFAHIDIFWMWVWILQQCELCSNSLFPPPVDTLTDLLLCRSSRSQWCRCTVTLKTHISGHNSWIHRLMMTQWNSMSIRRSRGITFYNKKGQRSTSTSSQTTADHYSVLQGQIITIFPAAGCQVLLEFCAMSGHLISHWFLLYIMWQENRRSVISRCLHWGGIHAHFCRKAAVSLMSAGVLRKSSKQDDTLPVHHLGGGGIALAPASLASTAAPKGQGNSGAVSRGEWDRKALAPPRSMLAVVSPDKWLLWNAASQSLYTPWKKGQTG